MAKRLFPILALAAFVLLAAPALAQMNLEDEAYQRQMAAESSLNEVWSMELEVQAAIDSRDNAQNDYNSGVMELNMGNWQAAIDHFDNCIWNCGQAIAYEEAGDMGDITGVNLPWGEDIIDIEEIGQGVRQSDYPMLMIVIFVSTFIVIPVTYKLV